MTPPFFLRTGLAAALTLRCAAGPYASGPDDPASGALPAASALFTAWADSVSAFQPGPQQAGSTATPAGYGVPASALGPPDAAGFGYPYYDNSSVPAAGPVVSLGDGGQITLSFSRPVSDGEGPDFAVFENGFTTSGTLLFAELAFVEVSSDGANFTRFPAVSLTPAVTQSATFSSLDPSNLYNLAGKFPAGYGTPFDLAELAGTPGLDTRNITHIRIIDVTGDVKNGRGSRDSLGNWINDPFPTKFASGGFDLDAVGVIHEAADPWLDWLAASFAPDTEPASLTPGADPDRDGRSNLIEYACGSPPVTPDPEPALQIEDAGTAIRLRFHRLERPGTILQLEQSRDARSWEPPAGAVFTGEGTLTTATVPRTGGALFRLKAIRQP